MTMHACDDAAAVSACWPRSCCCAQHGARRRAELAGSPPIGTASPGGTYYVYGEGLAKILTRALDLPVDAAGHRRPRAEHRAARSGRGEARLCHHRALRSRRGTPPAYGPARSRRAPCVPSFPCTTRRFSCWCCRTPQSAVVGDMAGKRVGVGPRGGTSAAYFPQFFDTLKVPVSLAFGEWAELAAQLHRAQARCACGRRRRAVSVVYRARGQGQGALHRV